MVILALAIGIGANIGVFSVVNGLLLRSLPFRDPDRLVEPHIFSPPRDSAKQFHDWRKQSTYFEDVALFNHGDVSLGDRRGQLRAHLAETSCNFLSLLGTQPVIGRAFASQEDIPGNDAVAVIGYGLWKQLFDGNPEVLGSTIRANGTPLTIIGVATGFDSPAKTVLWTPSVLAPGHIPGNGFLGEIIARLKTDISWAQARGAFAAEADRLSPNRRQIDKLNHPSWMSRLQDQLAGPVKNASLMLMAGVVLILLIASTNVANLLMARTADRATELSIRSALGASRARLLQQLLTESLLLSLAASAAGLLVAHWTTWIATKVQPAPLASQSYSILDGRVLGFCIAISVLGGLLFGFLPSWYAGRKHTFGTRDLLQTQSARFIREALVAVQVTLTIVLLVSSVSMGRAFLDLMHVDHGFETSGLVIVNVSLDGTIHEMGDRSFNIFNKCWRECGNYPESVMPALRSFCLWTRPFFWERPTRLTAGLRRKIP